MSGEKPKFESGAQTPFEVPEDKEINLKRRLGEKSNEVFEKENREGKKPEIAVNIFYSGHLEAQEAEEQAEKFAEADIYIPELVAWRPEILQNFRDCSEGKKTPAEIMKEWELTPGTDPSYSFRLKQLEMIYGSGKAVTFIDIPYGHPLEWPQFSFTYLQETSFKDNLENFKKFLLAWAERQKKREEYMVSRLRPKVQELLNENSALKEKDKLNVLLSLGAFHTGFWHALKKTGEKVSADFGAPSVIFSS